MNLTDVIEGLVEERGLSREDVISIVCEGVLAAYKKKYPEAELSIKFNRKLGSAEIFLKKEVVSSAQDDDKKVSLRKAHVVSPKAKLGDVIEVPLVDKIGRIEVLIAKQVIANKIRQLEQSAIAEEFKDKEGAIVVGNAHKQERAGLAVKIGDAMALLPTSNSIPEETFRIGAPIRALLREVLDVPRGDFQLILDRASADFVEKLLELEIPEIFEGIVEVKKIVRSPGYKTKVIVSSNNKEIDPVGTCVGVGGARIKPILRELSGEKIDLIESTESLDVLVKNSLKPAEIDKVEVSQDEKRAVVWLPQDQRSLAIGKMGRNISLASKLVGIEINLQEAVSEATSVLSSEEGE
ncbi:transcription termination factor NusA [Candidatus Babeliales bacterium]|nr:transcription termination factor NusA [Candidatus Babeliales bacterium]